METLSDPGPILTRATVNKNTEEESVITGFRRNTAKTIFAHFGSLLLLGLPYLLAKWRPKWRLLATCSKCPLLKADRVLAVHCESRDMSIIHVQSEEVSESFPSQYVVLEPPSRSYSDRSRLINEQRHLLRYFIFRHLRYVWNNEMQIFEPIKGLDDGQTSVAQLHEQFNEGLDSDVAGDLLQLHGQNLISVEIPSYFRLLMEEVFHPFYVFQVASIILWSFDDYLMYAGCIFFISFIGIVVALYQTRRQAVSLHDMVSSSEHNFCNVNRPLEPMPRSSEVKGLVPGDLIVIPREGCVMGCDAVLLTGTAIVNEAMLTGESVPVTKSSLPKSDNADSEMYCADMHKRHTLFAGTEVIQTRYYGSQAVYAVVVRTGFQTSKGELVRSILFPRPMDFKFYRDSMRFVAVLFCISAIGMAYCIYMFVVRGSSISVILLRTLDILTVVVPPALPAAMTAGTVYAQNRLKKKGIFCISPARINVCGKLKLVCFDKTGTLTEDGLDMKGVLPCKNGSFLIWDKTDSPGDSTTNHADMVEKVDEDLELEDPLLWSLAACHSLTRINDRLTGDPLDLKMFEATGWQLEEPGEEDTTRFDQMMPTVVRPMRRGSLTAVGKAVVDNGGPRPEGHLGDGDDLGDSTQQGSSGSFSLSSPPLELGIIRQFTFSSRLARMSVIVRTLDSSSSFMVLTKGAPEKLEPICLPSSIPADFHDRLKELTVQGYRVIAMATKYLPQNTNWIRVQKMKREEVESELNFLGFLVMQNTLKPVTKGVIHQLKDAAIKCVMITGDNLLTGISVARDCGMVEDQSRVVIVEELSSAEAGRTGLKFTEAGEGGITAHIDARNEVAISVDETRTVAVNMSQNCHFALTGNTWAVLKENYPELLNRIMVQGTIFARMAPDQKAQLVEELQTLGYVVAMCGDGANDCGALKAAHVGVSLSEAEASVAAPFTSKIPNISCIPSLILEGRCALVTSFGVFKYMALYSLIQFISVLVLYTNNTNLGDWQFLYIDLIITGTVAALMSYTGAWTRLVQKRPQGSLVSGETLTSIFSQIGASLAGQLAAVFYLINTDWYRPISESHEGDSDNVEANPFTTTIFIVSAFQYLTIAVVFSKGPPYRKPFYTNYLFLAALLILSGFTALFLFAPFEQLNTFFQLQVLPRDYQIGVLTLIFANAALNIILEALVHSGNWVKKLARCITRKKQPKNKYKLVLKKISQTPSWPEDGELYFSTDLG